MTHSNRRPPPGGRGDPLELSSYGGIDDQANSPIQVPAQANLLRNRRAKPWLRGQRVGTQAAAAVRAVRLKYLVERLHAFGPSPLYHFLDEVERGEPLRPHLERYAVLPVGFVIATGGDRFGEPLFVINGRAP